MKLHRTLLFVIAAALPPAVHAGAGGEASALSTASALASSMAGVVAGNPALLVGGSVLTIVAIEEGLGHGPTLVLKGLSGASTASVRLSAKAAGGVSLAVGGAVRVVGEASGQALYYAGKLIAFIPNEVGKSLVHHSSLRPGAQ